MTRPSQDRPTAVVTGTTVKSNSNKMRKPSVSKPIATGRLHQGDERIAFVTSDHFSVSRRRDETMPVFYPDAAARAIAWHVRELRMDYAPANEVACQGLAIVLS